MKPTTDELKAVLADHALCLIGAGGKRADLREADLSEADLSGANLSEADLRGADLSGATLQEARGILWAQCSWADHGQAGRMLTAIHSGGETTCHCGCFNGSPEKLRKYIAERDPEKEASRTIAADFVLARIDEMVAARAKDGEQ